MHADLQIAWLCVHSTKPTANFLYLEVGPDEEINLGELNDWISDFADFADFAISNLLLFIRLISIYQINLLGFSAVCM